jgi:hypothetical protein
VFKESEVVASNVSAESPPVNVFTPVVRVKDFLPV